MTRAFAIALCCLLAACGKPTRTQETSADEKLDSGEVAKVAVAPDGTTLWAVRYYGRTVFFSSRGTQHEVSYQCGKATCTETIITPNAR